MLTGHGDMDAVTAAGALDINGYILKPVSTEKLISTLERVMNSPRVLKDADEYRGVMLPDVAALAADSGNS
jgi:YesN/AraC family two-component response regulator